MCGSVACARSAGTIGMADDCAMDEAREARSAACPASMNVTDAHDSDGVPYMRHADIFGKVRG